MESDWQKAEAGQTVDGYQSFLRKHPASAHDSDALRKLEVLSWNESKKSSNVKTIEAFLVNYPQTKFRDESLATIDNISWQQAKSASTPDSLEDFLNNHPTSRFKEEAARLFDDLKLNQLQGFKYERIDDKTILITDGFFAKRVTEKLGYETSFHITDIQNGVFKTEGNIPLGFETAIGVTWLLDKPSLSFRSGTMRYQYTSKFAGATVNLAAT